MYAIIDHRVSLEIKKNLEKYVEGIFEFSSNAITYNSISGHPDIFIFQDQNGLIIAPNAPKKLINFLDTIKAKYYFGNKNVDESLNNSVLYNCLTNNNYFFCKPNKPDLAIQQKHLDKTMVNLPQAYTRCSMFTIKDTVITSDKGIIKELAKHKIESFYFEPSQIKIEDHKHGFIGGTMGIMDNKVFFLGNILKHKNGNALNKYITNLGKEVICLGTDYLYDGGSIFFV
ncbi:hypothetical protein SAMN05444411_108131 [Lutibacter oricola]|uniref:DUF6873 domain-containing protein n=1 Tax=Lutibacter oricola TaxID=762486 RepID=A0A1H3E055_9FLAO|nr:hypothetical protein [Lutibacter oricola]SDX72027.1 hypothetical protein SAMN05444411_108131 [Lutibacter oricola]